jgi:hypothetical protein
LRSARARRGAVRPVVVVSPAIDDEPFALEPLELIPLPVVPLPVVPLVVLLPVCDEPVAVPEFVVPVPVVERVVPDGPERTMPPGVVVVELFGLMVPDDEFGLVFAAPTPGEPDVPLWPPVAPAVPALLPEPVLPAEPVPDVCARAKPPPQVSAAAAARVRILEVCFMHVSFWCEVGSMPIGADAEASTALFGNRCAAEATAAAVLSANPYTRRCASGSRAGTRARISFPPECRQR